MVTSQQDKLFSMSLVGKRPWEVMPVSDTPVNPGFEVTLRKCLALRHLELPVGEWISNSSKQEQERIGTVGMKALKSNVNDEIRHDKQLSATVTAFKLVSPEKAEQIESEAKPIVDQWLLLANKYFPATVAFVAEAGCFIPALTFMRRAGNVALINVANSISNDEAWHLRVHKHVGVDIHGEQVSSKLDELRKATISWLFSDLADSNIPGKYGKLRTYMKASEGLVYNGVAKQFSETKRAVQHAFFEVSNNNLEIYGN